MSCGHPHETPCTEILDHLYEYIDNEMPADDCAAVKRHLDECSGCLEKYGLDQMVKSLVQRCCGSDDPPADLRDKVLSRIRQVRGGLAAAGQSE
jgi:mycothiol system anti-sigma-R factor